MVLAMYGARKYWPRGLRNNNPGNIRHNPANDWKGMTGQDSAGFVQFESADYGIRAMGRIIDSYRNRGIVTLRQIIEAWAPDTENDTDSYLSHVMQLTGWQAAQVPMRSEGDYQALVKAIITHENGRQPYSDEYISQALAMA